ncbi:hypothetical protein, partial [Dactylosporangium fulvum]|uniref:hypothetical protein n=1 Tax=Dactylosporangium fulvum TaxID=53359 RepID=UPI003CD07864
MCSVRAAVRAVPAVLAAALLAFVVTAAVAPDPASAAPLGTLTLSPTGGSVTADPMFTSATASAPCPAGYGTNVGLSVGKAGAPTGAYVSLAQVASDGPYDTAPPTLGANRSLVAAFRGAPVTDGAYTVIMRCVSESQGDHPDVFSVGITVSAGQWTATGGGPGPTGEPTTPPSGGADARVTITTEIGPGTATSSSAPPGSSGPLPRTGTDVVRIAVLGAALVLTGAAIVW